MENMWGPFEEKMKELTSSVKQLDETKQMVVVLKKRISLVLGNFQKIISNSNEIHNITKKKEIDLQVSKLTALLSSLNTNKPNLSEIETVIKQLEDFTQNKIASKVSDVPEVTVPVQSTQSNTYAKTTEKGIQRKASPFSGVEQQKTASMNNFTTPKTVPKPATKTAPKTAPSPAANTNFIQKNINAVSKTTAPTNNTLRKGGYNSSKKYSKKQTMKSRKVNRKVNRKMKSRKPKANKRYKTKKR